MPILRNCSFCKHRCCIPCRWFSKLDGCEVDVCRCCLHGMNSFHQGMVFFKKGYIEHPEFIGHGFVYYDPDSRQVTEGGHRNLPSTPPGELELKPDHKVLPCRWDSDFQYITTGGDDWGTPCASDDGPMDNRRKRRRCDEDNPQEEQPWQRWTRCPALCGRWCPPSGFGGTGFYCPEQCTRGEGHEGNHRFDCNHTLPPLPPARPPPPVDMNALEVTGTWLKVSSVGVNEPDKVS